jgi:hypothetical protein
LPLGAMIDLSQVLMSEEFRDVTVEIYDIKPFSEGQYKLISA